MAHTSSVERLFERYGPAYRWYATVTVMLGTLSVVLAATIINVAVPAIMARFALAQDEVQWLATAFLAAMTVGMLLNAWASARVGSRNAFVLAMGVFIAASLVGGLATSFGVLVAARVLQGVMAGMIQPQALVVIFQVFPVHRRGQAMGVYGMGVILGPAIAPALGGVLVDALSWRATFFVVLPACVLAIAMAWRFLPGRIEMHRPRLDWCGLVLLSLGLVATLWALASMQRRGLDDIVLLAALFGGPALLVVFALWERRCRQPLFDLRVFGVPGFTGGFLLSVVMGAGVFASTYLTPLYFQQVSGQSAAVAGLMLVPSGLAMALVFPLAGVLSDRAPIARVVGTGLLLFIAGTMALRAANGATATLWLVSWAVLARLGIGLMMPAVMMGSLGLLSSEMLDRGSGVISFGRQFGGALGVNLCAVLAQFASGLHAAAHPAQGRPAAFEAGFDDAFLALAVVFLLAFWPLLTMRKSQRYSG